MSAQHTQGRGSHSSRTHRSRDAYSSGARRPLSRKARDRQAGYRTAEDASSARVTVDASLDPSADTLAGAANGDYDRYSRRTVAAQHSSRASRSRYEDQDERYTAPARKRRKRKRIRTAIIIAVLVVLLGGVAVAGGLIGKFNSSLNSGIDDATAALLSSRSSVAKEPSYFLILGTDESEARDENSEYGGVFRSDTIILARVDPTTQTAALVSIPRDTKVELEDYGTQKINAASALGGSSLMIEAVEDLTGVDIDHYVEVDFDGFEDIVDALGGITVDVPMEIDDEDAGGHLDAGEQTLTGAQALILCRSRHSYDEIGAGDIYRSANQRLVLTAIADKLLSSDVSTITSVVNTITDYVTTDLTATDIIALAAAFQGIDTSTGIYTAQFPTTSVYEDGIWYEAADETEWAAMLERMDNGESPAESDETDEATGTVLATTGTGSSDGSSWSGTVVVRNGTTTEGLGAEAGETIEDMGFDTDVGNANESDYTETVIVYDTKSNKKAAKAIKKKLGVGTVMKNDGNYVYDGDVLVIIGTDY